MRRTTLLVLSAFLGLRACPPRMGGARGVLGGFFGGRRGSRSVRGCGR